MKEDRTDYVKASLKDNYFHIESIGYVDECFSSLAKGDAGKVYEQLRDLSKYIKKNEQIYLTLPTALFYIDCWQVPGSNIWEVKPSMRTHFTGMKTEDETQDETHFHYVDQGCNINIKKDNGFQITGAAIIDKRFIQTVEEVILHYDLNICSLEPEVVALVRFLAINQNFFTIVERFKETVNISVFNISNGIFTVAFKDEDNFSFEAMMYMAEKLEEETFEKSDGQKKVPEMPIYFGELSRKDMQIISKSKHSERIGKIAVPDCFKLTKKTKSADLSKNYSLCGLALKSLIVEDLDTRVGIEGGQTASGEADLTATKDEFSIKKLFSKELLSPKKKSNHANT
jgi:hypothetical protein